MSAPRIGSEQASTASRPSHGMSISSLLSSDAPVNTRSSSEGITSQSIIPAAPGPALPQSLPPPSYPRPSYPNSYVPYTPPDRNAPSDDTTLKRSSPLNHNPQFQTWSRPSQGGPPTSIPHDHSTTRPSFAPVPPPPPQQSLPPNQPSRPYSGPRSDDHIANQFSGNSVGQQYSMQPPPNRLYRPMSSQPQPHQPSSQARPPSQTYHPVQPSHGRRVSDPFSLDSHATPMSGPANQQSGYHPQPPRITYSQQPMDSPRSSQQALPRMPPLGPPMAHRPNPSGPPPNHRGAPQAQMHQHNSPMHHVSIGQAHHYAHGSPISSQISHHHHHHHHRHNHQVPPLQSQPPRHTRPSAQQPNLVAQPNTNAEHIQPTQHGGQAQTMNRLSNGVPSHDRSTQLSRPTSPRLSGPILPNGQLLPNEGMQTPNQASGSGASISSTHSTLVNNRGPLARLNPDMFRTVSANNPTSCMEATTKSEFGRVFSGISAGIGSGASSRRQSPLPQAGPPSVGVSASQSTTADSINLMNLRSAGVINGAASILGSFHRNHNKELALERLSGTAAEQQQVGLSMVQNGSHLQPHYPQNYYERRPSHRLHLPPHHHQHGLDGNIELSNEPGLDKNVLHGAGNQPSPNGEGQAKMQAKPAILPPSLKQPLLSKSDVDALIKDVSHFPRRRLGSKVYRCKVVAPSRATHETEVYPAYGYENELLPDFRELDLLGEGSSAVNCTIKVLVPRYYLSRESRMVICRDRRVWGSSIFTDDSDPLACAIHSGYVMGYWGEDVHVKDLFKAGGWPLREKEKERETEDGLKEGGRAGCRKRRLDEKAERIRIERGVGPAEPLEGYDLAITLLVLPPLTRYCSSTEFGVKSREWGGNHDGMSLYVLGCEWVDEGGLSGLEGRSEGLRERLKMRALEKKRLDRVWSRAAAPAVTAK